MLSIPIINFITKTQDQGFLGKQNKKYNWIGPLAFREKNKSKSRYQSS